MIRVLITGSKGRMGQALVACSARHPNLQVIGGIDQGDSLEPVVEKADVIIDFSSHTATLDIANICARHNRALVIGTTGLPSDDREKLVALGVKIPIVVSTNFSTGVNTLFWLTRKAAEILGPAFDLEVIEMHHRLKKDAPSGTAQTLAEILAETREQQLANVLRHGRSGITGERTPEEIGMHSLRGGDVVGDHTVVFAGVGERLELTHKASSRETFANGALRAAEWITHQQPGIYSMQDVLGLR
jgi:4-hydroxy-tetrahydrodipicolinate reductase